MYAIVTSNDTFHGTCTPDDTSDSTTRGFSLGERIKIARDVRHLPDLEQYAVRREDVLVYVRTTAIQLQIRQVTH